MTMPTREEVALGLFRAAYPGDSNRPVPGSDWFDLADYVLSLLARRPATDESEACVNCLRHIAEYRSAQERIADLESQLAAVTEEAEARRRAVDQLRAERDQLLRNVDERRLESKGLRAEREIAERNAREWEAREARATAELERVRAGLESCSLELNRARGAAMNFEALREQHEALRAACAAEGVDIEARKNVEYSIHGVSDWTARQLTRFYDRVQAALLKPAPAEAERASGICQSCGSVNMHSTACEALQHPPPESAMVEHERLGRETPRLAPLWTEVDALRSTLRTFLADWARGSFNKARAAEVLEALDARKGADRG